jgi:hypothetical protein
MAIILRKKIYRWGSRRSEPCYGMRRLRAGTTLRIIKYYIKKNSWGGGGIVRIYIVQIISSTFLPARHLYSCLFQPGRQAIQAMVKVLSLGPEDLPFRGDLLPVITPPADREPILSGKEDPFGNPAFTQCVFILSLLQYSNRSPGRDGVVSGVFRRLLACSYACAIRSTSRSVLWRPKI